MTTSDPIAASILETVGDTPLVELQRIGSELSGRLVAKMESFNPGGSVKDRIAISIIEEAEHSGALRPGGAIVESTSGNTGMGLALVAAVKGYKAIFVMPDLRGVAALDYDYALLSPDSPATGIYY